MNPIESGIVQAGYRDYAFARPPAFQLGRSAVSSPLERIREIVEVERLLKVLWDRHAHLISGPENAETVAELGQVQKEISDLVGRKERLLSEEDGQA